MKTFLKVIVILELQHVLYRNLKIIILQNKWYVQVLANYYKQTNDI